MEYAQYGSLYDLMIAKHVLDESEAFTYFHQLAKALEFCHSKRIAHRDLKLENLLLSEGNHLKIGDFGFARYFNSDDQTTFSSTFCGSNAYISPEILHQRPYNPLAADIWACGVVLFVMVFGDLPFDDSGSIRQLAKVRSIIFLIQRESVCSECVFFSNFSWSIKEWFFQTISTYQLSVET